MSIRQHLRAPTVRVGAGFPRTLCATDPPTYTSIPTGQQSSSSTYFSHAENDQGDVNDDVTNGDDGADLTTVSLTTLLLTLLFAFSLCLYVANS